MLKLAGCALIVGTSFLYAAQMRRQLSAHLSQLLAFQELLLALLGEISYTKTPLSEAFSRLSLRCGEPYAGFLQAAAGELQSGGGECFPQIWDRVLGQQRKRFLLTDEEWGMVEGVGEKLGYLDADMQKNHLRLYIGQAEEAVARARGELAGKQKLYASLSVSGGLFVILLLL